MKSDNLLVALSLNPEKEIQDRQRVFDVDGICPALRATDYKDPTKILEKKSEIIEVGNLKEGQQNWKSPQTGRVYSTEGISPTLNTCGGGGHEVKIVEKKVLGGIYTDVTENFNRGLYPNMSRTIKANKNDAGVIERKIVAMRGRNPDNPSDRTAGIPTEQRLEPNSEGICGTITTVQKDNILLEKTEEYVKIKQANSDGYIKCKIGGCADFSYPGSYTRRGRVIDDGNVSPTLMASNQDIVIVESQFRIRKLTPRESWRLMGFSDSDYEKAAEVNSKLNCTNKRETLLCAMYLWQFSAS